MLLILSLFWGNFSSSVLPSNAANVISSTNKPEDTLTSSAFTSLKQFFSNAMHSDAVSTNAVSENTLSENSISNNSVSTNSVSDNTVSNNTTDANTISDNITDANTVSDNITNNNAITNNNTNDNTVIASITNDYAVDNNNTNNNIASENITNAETVSNNNTDNNTVSNNTVSNNTPADDNKKPSTPKNYTIIFDFNGGMDANGNTSYTVTVPDGTLIPPYMQAAQDLNFISPYRFLGKWDMYVTETGEIFEKNGNSGKNETVKNKKTARGNYTYKALWSDEYADFYITYELNGGKFYEGISDPAIPYTFTYVDTVTLPSPIKQGYLFDGFYTNPSFTGSKVTTIAKGTLGDVTLYAKWISAAPTAAPTLTKIKNSSKGTIKLNFKKMKNIDGYELLMSTNKNFKKNTNTIDVKKTATSVKVTNLPKGKRYYFKLRAYVLDSTSARCYGPYSKRVSQKVTKGVTESKATASSAKLKACKIKNKTTFYVKFTVSKRLKSSDDSYYLVALNPANDKFYKEIKKVPKTKTVTIELPVRDKDGTDLIQGKYALAIKNGRKYKIISNSAFISNPEAAATYTAAFPTSRTKKGLQGSTDLSLGLSHTFFNIDLNTILNGNIPYTYNGKTYYFNDPWSHIITYCNQAGVTVTGQIMLSYDEATKYMILKSGRTPGKLLYAINAQEKKARETFEAATSFLAERYSRENCHLDNWILGNEVNIHQEWYYAGNISKQKFMKNYADTFRILYYSVKSHSKNSRVYICTDHTWTDLKNNWGTKPFMDAFNKEIKSQQKNIQWNLAYHAYPSNLRNAAVWNDALAQDNQNTSYVSAKNLSVLTKYVKKNFGKNTRIILSEQGFTSSNGQDLQAASLAYTYYKAEFDTMIDAVIFRSDYDHPDETKQGLYLGLMDTKGNKKASYDVFKYMDTPVAEQYTNKYLPTIGISKWKDIAPKYTLNRFK